MTNIMGICLIMACIAIGIFIAYNATIIGIFGVPSSLSNTFYLLQGKYGEKYGWIFTGMLYVVCGLLIAPWIDVTQIISPWSKYLTVLPFLTVVMLLFVGTAPNFREGGLPHDVHMTCAKLTAVFALLWVAVVCWQIMYIIPAWVLLCGGIAHLTKTAGSGRDWWLEMVAFGSTFTAILTELIIHL